MALTKVTNDLQDALAASQPTITSVGTLTGFTSTGIDDNATSTAITIDASENVGIGNTSPNAQLHIGDSSAEGNTTNPAIQIGGTTTYRLGMYTSAEGAVIENKNGDDGIQFRVKTAGEAMRIDGGTGNVGIGVSPHSGWYGNATVLQISPTGALYNTSNWEDFNLANNVYINSSGTDSYIQNDAACKIRLTDAGAMDFRVTGAGTAGAAITWTTAMAIDNGGRVSIGRSSDVTAKCLELQPPAQISDFGSYILNIGGNEADDAVGTKSGIGFGYTSTARPAAPATIGYETKNTSGGTYGDLYFATRATSGTEQPTIHLRIDSSGNLLAGATSGSKHTLSKSVASGGMLEIINSSGTAPSGTAFKLTGAAPNNGTSTFFTTADSSAYRGGWLSNGGIQNYQANNSNLSDRREKTNFVPAKSYLDIICGIPVQTFNYIDQNMDDDDSPSLGVIAQDVQAVAPELVVENNWGTEDQPKMRLSIYQTDLQYALMKAMQEQQAIIESLTARLEALEGE